MLSRHQPASSLTSASNLIAYLDGEACFVNLWRVKRIKVPFVFAND